MNLGTQAVEANLKFSLLWPNQVIYQTEGDEMKNQNWACSLNKTRKRQVIAHVSNQIFLLFCPGPLVVPDFTQ